MKNIILAISIIIGLSGCGSEPIEYKKYESSTLSSLKINISTFVYDKKIIIKNIAIDEIFMEIEGKCLYNRKGDQIKVTCMLGEDKFTEYDIVLTNNMAVSVVTKIE